MAELVVLTKPSTDEVLNSARFQQFAADWNARIDAALRQTEVSVLRGKSHSSNDMRALSGKLGVDVCWLGPGSHTVSLFVLFMGACS